MGMVPYSKTKFKTDYFKKGTSKYSSTGKKAVNSARLKIASYWFVGSNPTLCI